MLREFALNDSLSGTEVKVIRRRLLSHTVAVRSVGASKQLDIPVFEQKVVGALILQRVYPDQPITVYRRFSGVGTAGQTGEAFIEGLDNRIITSRRGRVTVTAGPNEHVYVAVPVSAGLVSIRYNGYEGGFKAPRTETITDDLTGASVDYYLYESVNDNLGTVTLDVY